MLAWSWLSSPVPDAPPGASLGLVVPFAVRSVAPWHQGDDPSLMAENIEMISGDPGRRARSTLVRETGGLHPCDCLWSCWPAIANPVCAEISGCVPLNLQGQHGAFVD